MSCSKSPIVLLLLLCFCRWDDNNTAASATSSSATTNVGSKTSISSSSLIVPNNDNNEQQIDQHPSSSSSTTTTQPSSSWSNNILQQSIQNQDPYVAASPLSVAAVCNDGIALVSLHYNADHEEDEEEGQSTSEIANVFRDLPISTRGPLRIEPIYENANHNDIVQSSSYHPPPMALLTAGWRTDGLTLCNAARELISDEVRLFCLPALTTTTTTMMMTNNNNEDENMSTNVITSSRRENGQENRLIENIEQTSNINVVMKKETITQQPQSQAPQIQQQKQQSSYHGRRIAEGLSYYLSKCQFSSGVRSLSTVGLLACGTTGGSSSSTNNNNGGSLYLIDTTGTHQVRAHAIGNGSFNVHKRMVFIDFSTMDCLEGLKVLLRLIAEEGGLALPSVEEEEEKEGVENDDDTITIEATKSNSNSILMIKKPAFLTKRQNQQHSQQGKDEEEEEKLLDNLPKWNIPSNTAVELAVLEHGDGRLRRIRLSSLMQ